MAIKDIFKRRAWHTLFHGRGSADPQKIKDATNAIVVEGLDKEYNGMNPVHAVKNVSFTVKRGEVIVLIGPNGAGKSTIINTVSGAIKNTGGSVSLFDDPATTQFQEIHKYLGICFQENVLCGLLSVKEHFELFGALRGIAIDDLNAAIEFFSSTLQLEHVLATRARDLSGGQKRKLCLALAILGNPPLVIMDEPTAGVDVQARQLIWQTIAGLKESTCIITSHALEEAEAVSSRLFIAAHGEMPFKGTSTELRRQFNCGYLLRVDGETDPVFELAKSIIPGTVISDERNDTLIVPVDRKVSELLLELETNPQKYGVKSYSFGVEQLEDTLLKMIQHAEAEIDLNH
jgi:ABC-type multidrug transport system ATPase subunit